MAYTKTTWVNNQAPAINADNLNKIEDGIYNSVRYADAQTLTDAQKTQAEAQRKMASLNQSYQMQLQQKVSAALQDIAKEKKLDVVVDSEKEQPTALMGCVDVTDDVIAKLQ